MRAESTGSKFLPRISIYRGVDKQYVPGTLFQILNEPLLQGPRRLSVQSKVALRDRNIEFQAMKKVSVRSLAMDI